MKLKTSLNNFRNLREASKKTIIFSSLYGDVMFCFCQSSCCHVTFILHVVCGSNYLNYAIQQSSDMKCGVRNTADTCGLVLKGTMAASNEYNCAHSDPKSTNMSRSSPPEIRLVTFKRKSSHQKLLVAAFLIVGT